MQQLLSNLRIEATESETRVYLETGQLPRKDYVEYKKILEFISGKWNSKSGCFIYDFNAEHLFELLKNHNISIRKDYQFYPTPESMIDIMFEHINIDYLRQELTNGTLEILEPSAGRGAIISRLQKLIGENDRIDYCEYLDINQEIISQNFSNVNLVSEDFTKLDLENKYDLIVANPPFNKNQDINHIMKMYSHLKDNGRLISLMSSSFLQQDNKVVTDFKKWLVNVGATFIRLDASDFEGIGIKEVVMILITKVKEVEYRFHKFLSNDIMYTVAYKFNEDDNFNCYTNIEILETLDYLEDDFKCVRTGTYSKTINFSCANETAGLACGFTGFCYNYHCESLYNHYQSTIHNVYKLMQSNNKSLKNLHILPKIEGGDNEDDNFDRNSLIWDVTTYSLSVIISLNMNLQEKYND